MLYAILLLILAVLLFGSSAVIGAAGYALGFAAAAVGLIWLGIAFELPPVLLILLAIVGFFATCGLIMLIAKIVQPYEIARMERKAARQR